MFAFMTHCIYCLAPLPEERSGIGEHIIPKSIYGFWRSYDVCRQCMNHFGQHVDGLAASCPAIVRAMERLNLPEAERFARNLPYEGADRLTNTSIPYILKPAGFMPKVVQQEDDLFNCPEGRWKELAVPFLRAATRDRVRDKEFDAAMERLSVLYDELPKGGTVESEILGYIIRKGAIGNITVNTDNAASVTPLIAKIAVAFMWLILPPRELAQLCDVVQLVDHARHGGSIRPFLINWCPLNLQYPGRHRRAWHHSDPAFRQAARRSSCVALSARRAPPGPLCGLAPQSGIAVRGRRGDPADHRE